MARSKERAEGRMEEGRMAGKHMRWVKKAQDQWELKSHFLDMTGDGTLGRSQLSCTYSSLGLAGKEGEQGLDD